MDDASEDDFRHLTIDVPGVRLHVVEAGPTRDAPLVVLLHGFPEHWWTWRHQLRALADAGYRAVAPDLRGYNLSDKPRGREHYRLERLTGDVDALIRACGEERACVVAHDWGGLIAWEFAMHHPERVERLVVMNMPHPVVIRREVWKPPHLWKLWYVYFFQLPWLPEWAMRAGDFALIRAELSGSLTPAELARYLEASGRPGALHAQIDYYRAAFREYVSGSGRAPRRIDVPVLMIWGVRDRHIVPSLAPPPAELVPDVRIEWLAEATHWLQHDAPDAVNAHLLAFLGAPRASAYRGVATAGP